MGYENAPGTIMLATNCAACGRPLLDAASIEAGMGPDCREKYGYAGDVPEANREEANRIVHEIANRRGEVSTSFADLVLRVQDLGLPRLAARLLETAAKIRITEEDSVLAVKTPYNPEAVADARYIPGRRWDKDRKVNTFPRASAGALMAHLQRFYHGMMAIGPKGVFIV